MFDLQGYDFCKINSLYLNRGTIVPESRYILVFLYLNPGTLGLKHPHKDGYEHTDRKPISDRR